MVEGLFDTVELLNAQLPHKIDGQGLCVIHCKPINHYILAENMDNDRNIKVWDGQRHPTDNVNTRTQMAKLFVTDNEDTLEYMSRMQCNRMGLSVVIYALQKQLHY